MFRSRLLCSTLIVAASSLAFAETAAAQAAPRTASMIEEVVVTARKREELLQTVPVAITAVSGEALEEQGIDSPLDLDRIAPSLSAGNSSADPSGVSYSLRGQNPAGSFQVNANAAVASYQDGVNIAHSTGQGNGFLDVVRVEVLNGPQGTLYGRNSTGGAINIITRDADYAGVHGFLQAEAGNFDHVRLMGAVNVPLVEDKLTVRLAASQWWREGFGHSAITGQDLGEDKNDTDVRLSVTFDPISTLSIQAKAEYINLDRNGELNVHRNVDARYANDPRVLPAVQAIGFQHYTANTFNNRQNPGNPTAAPGVNTQQQARLDAGSAGYALLQPYLTSGGNDYFTNYISQLTYDQVESWFGALEINWDITDSVLLKSVTGYRQFAEYRVFDNDGLPYNLSENSWGVAGDGPEGINGICANGTSGTAALFTPSSCFAPPFAVEPYNQSEFYSQEFNLSGEAWEGKFSWLVGLFGSWDDMSSTQHPVSRIGFRPFDVANTASRDCTRSYSAALRQTCASVGGARVTDPAAAGSAAAATPVVPVTGTGPVQTFPLLGYVSFDGDAYQSTWGLFTQDDIRFTDQLTLTLGVRYGEERQSQNASFSTLQFSPVAVPAAGLIAGYNWLCLVGQSGFKATEDGCKVHQGGSDGKFSGTAYTASLNWQATEETLVYVKTARGFRGGGFNMSSPGAPPQKMEIATDYELGVKTDLFDRRLRLNMALYQTNYDNKAEAMQTLVNGVSQIQTLNAASARIRGLETQFFVFPLEGLSLYGSFTYLDAQYLNYPGAPIPGEGSILPAAPSPAGTFNASGLPFADPNWRYNIGARYEMQVGPGELSGQLDWSWRDKANITALNRDPSVSDTLRNEFTQARGLLNGSLTYYLEDQGMSFSLWGTNLTDEHYQVAGVPPALLNGVGSGGTQAPLMYGITVKKSFGEE